MALQWTEQLETGINLIDTQHKELIDKVNELLEACQQGKGKHTLSGFIDFLAEYVVMHFSEEEKYMKQFKYPEYAEHKAQHTQFLKSFGELKTKFDLQGSGTALVLMTNRTVVDWLVTHIKRTDKALGEFLKDKVS